VALDTFMSGKAQVAIINHKVGGFSLDGLQVANYLFVYESPVSCIDREQMERRILRQGQKHRVFQYDLLMHGTMDERILHAHKEGADLFKQLVADPEKILGLAAESR
jgi:SNF2 family DNA or RNA helicase